MNILCSLTIPNVVFINNNPTLDAEKDSLFAVETINEYKGALTESPQVIRTITDFCFNLAIGNLDDAIKNVRMVGNDSIWEIMAKICAKSANFELSKICLRKLKNAKALRTISKSCESENLGEIKAANLLVHMGS
jgi:hypothetical protein